MPYKKLGSGFLVTDLKEAETSIGQVRLSKKILRSGAEQLARAATYLFAAHQFKIGGASAAINATPEKRGTAIAEFLNEITHLMAEDIFLPDPGKGLTVKDLAPLSVKDSRSQIRLQDMDGINFGQYCTGLSAVIAAEGLLSDLENKTVIIEGFGPEALGALRELKQRNATLVGAGTENGFIYEAKGLDYEALDQAYQEHGSDFLDAADYETMSAKAFLKTPVDVLFVGSKMGVIDHTNADGLEISALASLHPIPYTARALSILNRKGVLVPPDFACLGGQLCTYWPKGEPTEKAIIQDVISKTSSLVSEMQNGVQHFQDKENKPALFLAGCAIAEDFLKSWQEELPFGRPLA